MASLLAIGHGRLPRLRLSFWVSLFIYVSIRKNLTENTQGPPRGQRPVVGFRDSVTATATMLQHWNLRFLGSAAQFDCCASVTDRSKDQQPVDYLA